MVSETDHPRSWFTQWCALMLCYLCSRYPFLSIEEGCVLRVPYFLSVRVVVSLYGLRQSSPHELVGLMFKLLIGHICSIFISTLNRSAEVFSCFLFWTILRYVENIILVWRLWATFSWNWVILGSEHWAQNIVYLSVNAVGFVLICLNL